MVITPETLRECGMTFRQALLLMVDALERLLDINPRTAELRRSEKNVS